MKKSVFIATVLLVALAVFCVSCNSNVEPAAAEQYSLKLSIFEESARALATDATYTAGLTVASYEYKAACTTTPGAHGTQSTWASLTVTPPAEGTQNTSGGSARLDNLDRGSWTIDVRAKNANGGVILQGQATVVLTADGQDMAITLKNTITDYSIAVPATVAVSVGVTTPTLASGAISVKYVALSAVGTLAADGSVGTAVEMDHADNYETTIDGAGIAHSTAAGGKTAYYGSANLNPGLYAMQILYKDGATVVAGQIIAFRVEELNPFAINGTLTAGEFLDLDITPITLDERVIAVSWATPSGTPAADGNSKINAQVNASSAVGALGTCTYTWFVDGKLEANAKEPEDVALGRFTSTNAFQPGTHQVTCVVSATIDGIDSVGFINYELAIN